MAKINSHSCCNKKLVVHNYKDGGEVRREIYMDTYKNRPEVEIPKTTNYKKNVDMGIKTLNRGPQADDSILTSPDKEDAMRREKYSVHRRKM